LKGLKPGVRIGITVILNAFCDAAFGAAVLWTSPSPGTGLACQWNAPERDFDWHKNKLISIQEVAKED